MATSPDGNAQPESGQRKADPLDQEEADARDTPQPQRPDPEDAPAAPAEHLDDDFDPAEHPSNPDLVG